MIAILLDIGWEYHSYSEELDELLLKLIPKKYETFPMDSSAMNILVNQNLILKLRDSLHESLWDVIGQAGSRDNTGMKQSSLGLSNTTKRTRKREFLDTAQLA